MATVSASRAGRRTAALYIGAAAIYAVAIGFTGMRGAASGSGGTTAGDSEFLLKGVEVPEPPDLAIYVRDRQAAVALGKALFWDAQAGSDGKTACASCHFHAGADNRATNSVNPGYNGTFTAGPNLVSVAAEFPFHKLSNPDVNTSTVMADRDDVFGSQGVFLHSFIDVGSTAFDACSEEADATFHVGGINVRRVTDRHTSTNINAVFNFRNFWDGRASENFNGANPGGQTDPNARIYRNIGGVLTPVSVLIANSSAASQATGPALSGTEMSCDGRSWPKLGRKLLRLLPLDGQHVAADDSVLGPYYTSSNDGRGLNTFYAVMISNAFQPDLWNSSDSTTIGGTSYSQMEANFSLYWGLAIQMYQSALVSDDAPIDQYLSGNTAALTEQQKQGLALFTGQARCSQCHRGPIFSAATQKGGRSFVNVAVRPTAEDGGDVAVPGQGRFKVPTLRNIELTGPYFHNGGQGTLRQVVDFYNRGGDFPDQFTDSQIRPLGLSSTERDAIVAFLLSLTDERVRWKRAPFDHPELCVPNGQVGNSAQVSADGSSIDAKDVVLCLPAIGRGGMASPLTTFLGLAPNSR